jgi:hypothetical protein
VALDENGVPFTTQVLHRVLEALTRYPDQYYAGTVGPDGFPDVTYGQRVIHPSDTGTWISRILDMAWAAQSSPEFTDDEGLQILAFAYGYATHAAGDFFAHTLVNEFAEGVFPAFDIVIGQTRTDAANAIRHIVPRVWRRGFDSDGTRSLLPNGDLAADSTPGLTYDAPMRFMYEALTKPFPGDPTSAADTGWGQTLETHASSNSITRVGGDFLFDNFQPGMEIFVFGFSGQPNPRKSTSRQAGIGDRRHDLRLGHPGPTRPARFPSVRSAAARSSSAATAGHCWTSSSSPAHGGRGAHRPWRAPCRRRRSTAPRGGHPLLTDGERRHEILTLTTDAPDCASSPAVADIDLGVSSGAASGSRRRTSCSTRRRAATGRTTWRRTTGSTASAATPRGIGFLDVLLAELGDPNRDGNFDDSRSSHRILPMLGLPKFIGDIRSAVSDFGALVDDLVLSPVRFIMEPLKAPLRAVKAIVKDVIISAIEHATGLDFDQIEQLEHLSNKMDLGSVTVKLKSLLGVSEDVTIPIFKPGDHAKIDAYLRPGRRRTAT